MVIPSYSALLSKDKLIKTVQELCEIVANWQQSAIIANQAMPEAWLEATSMSDLINMINADETAVRGTVFLSTLSLSDLPASMIQAEVKAEVLDDTPDIGKVILFTITSNNTSPYHWEYTSAYGEAGTWRSFVPN